MNTIRGLGLALWVFSLGAAVQPISARAQGGAPAPGSAQAEAGEPRANTSETPGADGSRVNTDHAPSGRTDLSPATPARKNPSPASNSSGSDAGTDGKVMGPGGKAAAASQTSDAGPQGAGAAKKGDPSGKPRTASGRPGADRLDLGTATVTGDREQPKVMYIVPWKRSDIGDLAGKPMNSLVDEILAPVDRDVFKREVVYFQAVQADAPKPSQGEK